MGFWELRQAQDAVAAIDGRSGQRWTYAELRADVQRRSDRLPSLGRRSLGLLLAQNRYECLVTYLAALRAGSALILVDAGLHAGLLGGLVEKYRPDWIFTAQASCDVAGYRPLDGAGDGLWVCEEAQGLALHADLALLLSTSGSTGSPKLVRLTLRNLEANAGAIAEYLGLTAEERPITSLPMPYSYGLSVINSHLHVGAALVLSDDGVLQREFWEAVEGHACTSFAGVPYTYQLLLQAGLLSKRGASLRTLTQAGGRLESRFLEQMLKLSGERGWRFFVMYGQTEATARMAYVPWGRLQEKMGSVGVAVPGGRLEAEASTGELVYTGPNTMMGYAESREDLAKGDELQGVLRTGDLARRDEDGFFFITGRLKRFLKLFGKRFNLDDVERVLADHFAGAVGCYGRDDLLVVSVEGCLDAVGGRDVVCRLFDLPRTAVQVIAVTELPRTANGKLDYQRLQEGWQEQGPAVIR